MSGISFRRVVLALALVPTLACAGNSGEALVIGPEPPPHDDPQPQHVVTEMPPHRFETQTHGDRVWPGPTRVNLASLPPVKRSTQCVRPPRDFEPVPAPVYQPKKRPPPPKPVPYEKKGKNKGASRAPGAGANTTYSDLPDMDNDRAAYAEAAPAPTTASGGGDGARYDLGKDRKRDRGAKRRNKAKKNRGGGAAPSSAPEAPAAEMEMEPPRDYTDSVESSAQAKSMPAGAAAPMPDDGEAYYEEDYYYDDYRQDEIALDSRSERDRRRAERKEARELKREVKKAKRLAKKEAKQGARPRPDDDYYYDDRDPNYREPIEPDPIQIVEEPEYPPPGEGWGDATYLSNDDTMSLSSAQRTIYAIENYQPLPLAHIRPHELMNYFTFETSPVAHGRDFSVKMELDPEADEQGLQTLAVAVQGREVTHSTRRNANLTLVVDRSGSMRDEGRMAYLKRGLHRMTDELRDGDIINIVSFDHRVCVPIQNFVVGRDNPKMLDKAIDSLRPSGNTNLFAGLSKGYELADQSYRDGYTNRVVMITDALANKGETDARVMAMAADWYDSRRIRLSGIGVGRNFNDHLLDRLTEKGRGAYVFLGSEAEVDAVFGRHFVSMIETTANDVHFRLHLPPSLRLQQFHGEEASTNKAEVQAIHYFANTSQMFLSDLEAWKGELRPQDEVMLEIEYMDPESGQVLREDYAFRVGDIAHDGKNLRKAELVKYWIDGVREISARSLPPGWAAKPYGWQDPYGWERCQTGMVELDRMAEGLDGDSEVNNILRLWNKQCERFAKPRKPGRKYGGEAGWPGARG